VNSIEFEYGINYSSLLKNIEKYSIELIKKKILVFRNINLSIKEQKNVSLLLNNILDFEPKTQEQFHIMYRESHSHVSEKKENSKESLLIDWHLEHVESSNPQVLALWNMKTFKCDTSCGNTGFVDSEKVLQVLSGDEIRFLKKSIITSVDDNNLLVNSFVDEKNIKNEVYPHAAIQTHPVTQRPCLRVDVLNRKSLYKYDNRIPSNYEMHKFDEIYSKIVFEVVQNKSNQIWLSWQEGDLAIVDLFCMYHAVKGGFSTGERKFVGFWSFANI
jgi:alpha-ketoglutarate-dependent taurine dioxygenase